MDTMTGKAYHSVDDAVKGGAKVENVVAVQGPTRAVARVADALRAAARRRERANKRRRQQRASRRRNRR